MASPFSVFRKHQAAMLAVFGVLIIVVFTIGDSLSRTLQGSGRGQDPRAVQWRGQALTEGQLYSRGSLRAFVGNLLHRLQRVAVSQGAFGQYGQMLLQYNQLPVRPVVPRGPVRPVDTVQIMVLGEKARDMGYVVTDEEISRHLFDLVDNKLTDEQIRFALAGPDGRMSMRQIFAMLREEMLAGKLYQDIARGWRAPPAGRQLDFYARLNRQLQLELAAVPVENFVGQVEEPTDRELNKYFDEYKTVVKLSDNINGREFYSPKPGFKLPHRVSVEYVKGSAAELLDEVRDTITDEEIKKYYNDNKIGDEFLHAEEQLGLLDLDKDKQDDDAKRGAAQKEDVQEKDVQEKNPREDEAQDDDAQADDLKASGSAADKTTENKATEKKATEKTAKEKDAATEIKDKQPDDPAGGNVADDTSSEQPASKAADGGDTKTSIAKDGQSGDKEKTDETKDEKKEIEFKPLDEVRDHIHQQLAERRARERLEEKFKQIRSKMSAYHEARLFAEVGESPAYERPDIKATAKKAGLEYKNTGLLSAEGFAASKDIKIGASMQAGEITADDRYPEDIDFGQIAFQEGAQSLFKPAQTVDDQQVYYLFWKTEEALEAIPKLEDVRDEVVHAWKVGAGRTDETGTARGLALKWAEAAATEVSDGGDLAAVAKQQGAESHETDFFSWVSTGTAPGANQMNAPLQLGNVGGVEIDGVDVMQDAGPDFMKTVYGLKVGEAAAARDHAKKYVYVAKLLNENKSAATIQENFLDDLGNSTVAQQLDQVASMEWQTLQQDWWQDVEREFDLVWLKPELRYQGN